MIEIALAGFVYFEACGFELKDTTRGDYAKTMPAPNIAGYWVKKEQLRALSIGKHKKV